MQQNKTTHCQLRNKHTKPEHQNKTAAPLRLTKATVCPDTEPRNRQARKATDAQQQQQKNTPKQKNPNKTDTRRKEEAAVKGEGATGPSRQLMIETIPPHTSVKLNQSAM